jgi:hypothetical protein
MLCGRWRLWSLAKTEASTIIRTSSSFLILHFQFPGDSFGVGRVTNESLVILIISRLINRGESTRPPAAVHELGERGWDTIHMIL